MPFCADLFYRSYNGGSEGFVFPVILLHGMGGSLMGWPSSLRRLPGQRVVALDLPGHGHSDQPACRSISSLVGRLHQFITEIGFYHVILVGYSLGGALALSYASAYPDQIIGLVAISCGDQFVIPQELLSALSKPADIRIAVEVFSKAAFHPAFPQAERRAILAPMALAGSDALLADLSLAAEFRLDHQPALLKFPSLVIGGSNDLITPPASLRRLGHCLQRPSLAFIEGAGHMVIYEKNEELRTIVSAFLAKINKPG
ncbi:MAG: alpha/beta hydrolase [Anaerolineaceae bacterium]|nr:alpha/beta hydrolase [Anaerolineaceae bacterium]